MGVHGDLHAGISSAMAYLVSGKDSIIFLGECTDWYNLCLVGLSALCYWMSYRVGIDKMANQGKGQG